MKRNRRTRTGGATRTALPVVSVREVMHLGYYFVSFFSRAQSLLSAALRVVLCSSLVDFLALRCSTLVAVAMSPPARSRVFLGGLVLSVQLF